MRKCTLKNLKRTLLCCCLIGSIPSLNAQDLEWVKHIGGPESDDGRSVAIDADGNIYTTGRFKDTVDFDPGPGVHNLTATGTNFNAYILKLDATGSFLWAKQFEGSGNEPKALALDSSRNVYVTGGLPKSNTIDFDPGAGVVNLSVPAAPGLNQDVYVVKLDTSGNLEWARQLGGSKYDQSTDITVDDSGNVYTSGTFRGTADFNPGVAVDNLIANNSTGDCFISKLDTDGNYVWAKSISVTYGIYPGDIEADHYGNIYIMGTFTGTADFDPGTGVQNLATVMGEFFPVPNPFICKLDNDGNYIWAKNVGNSSSAFGASGTLALDDYGHLYLAGGFSDTVDFDPGPGTSIMISTLTGVGDVDLFVSKLDTAGNYIWAKSMGSISIESGRPLIDNYGNLYLVGGFRGPVDMDPSDTGVHEINPSSSSGGVFIAKYDSSCSFSWVTFWDATLGSNGFDVALSPIDNAVFITGDFSSPTDFDPGVDTVNLIPAGVVGSGWGDAFILKLKNCYLLTSTISTTACDSFTLNDTTYLVSGTYNQTHVTANGCDSILTLQLIINHKPSVAVTQTGNTLSANTVGATYQWINCNNDHTPVAGATQQTFTATADGNYAVVITKDGCSDTSICYTVTTLGIQDKSDDQFFKAYPNPVSDALTITTNSVLKAGNLRLMNILGQTLIEQSKLNGSKFHLDLVGIAQGTYILEVKEDTKVSRIKIVKE